MIEHTATRYHPRFAYYSQDAIIGASLREYGEYAQPEVDLLLSVLATITCSPRVVYDVGGNIGYHTTAFASVSDTQVHAFEPNPLNYAMLRENTNHLAHVHLHRMAVADYTGHIQVETFDPAESSNFGEIHVGVTGGITMPCSRLDDLDLPPADLIKIDVEGFEWEVLQGATRVLQRRPVVYYEAMTLRNFDKIYHMMTDLDYKLVWATIRNYNAHNLKKNPHNMFGSTAIFNVLAWPGHWPEVEIGTPVLGPHDDWQRFCA